MASWCVRWLSHVVGDAHQPLHATDRFDKQFPEGDHGGNLCKVNFPGYPDITSLHMVWDSAGGLYGGKFSRPLSKANFEMIRNQSDALRQEWPRSAFSNVTIDHTSFEGWLNESNALGEKVAYENGDFKCG